MKHRRMIVIGLIPALLLILILIIFLIQNNRGSESESISIAHEPAENVTFLTDIQYQKTEEDNCYLNIAFKDDGEEKPLLILVHGGSWISGSKEEMNSLLYTFSALGYTVASTDYDLLNLENALQGECVSILDEEACIAAAAEYLSVHAEEYQIDTSQVVLIGHSSGGQLVGHLSEQIADYPEKYSFQLKGVALLAAASDFRYFLYNNISMDGLDLPLVEIPFIFDGVYGSDVIPEINKADVLYNVTENLPPILIVHGSDDTSVPVLLSQNLYNTLKTCGVSAELAVIPGAGHSILDNKTVFFEINRFLEQYILDSKGE